MLFLNDHQGSTLRDLADALGSDLATASALVDRLMSQGLIRRETDPTDRRRARILLSDEGTELLAPVSEARTHTNALIEEALGADDARQLARLLGKLQLHMNERTSQSPLAAKKEVAES